MKEAFNLFMKNMSESLNRDFERKIKDLSESYLKCMFRIDIFFNKNGIESSQLKYFEGIFIENIKDYDYKKIFGLRDKLWHYTKKDIVKHMTAFFIEMAKEIDEKFNNFTNELNESLQQECEKQTSK